MRLVAIVVLAAAVTVAAQTRPDAISELNADPPTVLLSRQLMESRALEVGDVVRFASEPSGQDAKPFRIAGQYEPIPDPMQFAQPAFEARLHLPDLIAFNAQDAGEPLISIDSMNVALTDPAHRETFAREIEARFPGVVARSTDASNERTATFIVIERFHTAVAIVTMLGSGLFLLALMVMLVDERRESVGMLRLIGLTRGRILKQLVVEGAFMAIAGTIAGLLFAVATQSLFNRFFQWRYDTTLVFLRITPEVVVQSVALAVPVGIAASVIASWPLLRRRPLSLMRR